MTENDNVRTVTIPTGGERLVIGPPDGVPWIDAELAALRRIWDQAIPRRLEEA